MKLYYFPGACSLATWIALVEAGAEFETDRADIVETKRTDGGENFLDVNPRGYVPALKLDDGTVITENVAVHDWIAGEYPALGVDGPLGRTRLLERLGFVSTELHQSFRPLFRRGSEIEQTKARALLDERFGMAADMLEGDFLFGDRFTVADAYLFVMTLWAKKFEIALPERLQAFQDRVSQRPSVQAAMAADR